MIHTPKNGRLLTSDESERLTDCVKSGLVGFELIQCIDPIRILPQTNAPQVKQEATSPGTATKVWNFTVAITRWIAAGRPVRSKEKIAELLKICQSCPHLVETKCSQCGCQCVETEILMNKLALATEKCPIGKWS